MNPKWVLLARLDGLIARLELAQQAIAASGQNTRLQKRIGADLARRLVEYTEALKGTRRRVANNQMSAKTWGDIEAPASADLLDEALLYLQAAHSRGPDALPDLCEITDALFQELGGKSATAPWNSFSVFSAEDSFDALKHIIRVRYPVSAVWDLPVAVHEFGHYVSGKLHHQRPDSSTYLSFQEYKGSFVPPAQAGAGMGNGAQTGTDWKVYLDEIFADVFAAYAAGPSFACSCVLMRFNPALAHSEADGKHPSYAKRVYLILQTLRSRSNEKPGRRKLDAVIQLLDDAWRAACQTASISPDLSEEDRTWLSAQVSTIYYMLKNDDGGLRFNQWETAGDKLKWLEEREPASPGDYSILELLNTAWMCRLKEGSNPAQISENFLKLARRKLKMYD